jgi:uncharacterized membrane protein YhhN
MIEKGSHMTISTIVGLALSFLTGLLYFEHTSSMIGRLLTKPVVSLLFVVTAFHLAPSFSVYVNAILAGLILCLVGDVCLISMDSKKMFVAGLVAFLSGHVAYLTAFYPLMHRSWQGILAAVVFAAVAWGVYSWLKPHLGSMKNPVMAYILIITAMIVSAFAVFSNGQVSDTGRYLVVSGAGLFYISDLFVARNQFVKKAYVNRLLGLPLYFAGQFLLAASVAYLG